MKHAYLYFRTHESYDKYDAYKFGKTISLIDRETLYITTEIKKGYFIMVIAVDLDKLDKIELNIKRYLNQLGYNVYIDSGTEFYKKKSIEFIENYLIINELEFKVLKDEDIKNLFRLKREINVSNNLLLNTDINILNDIDNSNIILPRDYQNDIISIAYEYYKNNNKGLLVIPCGVGKTLISLWITKKLNLKRILIGAPNKVLVKQWYNIVKLIFNNKQILMLNGEVKQNDIIEYMELYKNDCIIITTYSSAYKINKYDFDIKILDEAHHLTSININKNEKQFIEILNINSQKQLALTATTKDFDNIDLDIISNNNEIYFGKIIDKRSLTWAINKKIVTDYIIQTLIFNDEEIDLNLVNNNIIDKQIFMSAFAALKNILINNSHHILVYTNNKENSLKVINFIKILIDNKYFPTILESDLYYSDYNSDISPIKQKYILDNFNKYKYGILSCVYCLGEGYDNPLIDSVIFADSMSSNIRIVQSALRGCRINKNEPNKIAKIILPIINNNDWLDNSENLNFKKIKEIIMQLSLEDNTISQKITVFNTTVSKSNNMNNDNLLGTINIELSNKLLLKTIKRQNLHTYLNYEKAIELIKNKLIKNKEEYYEYCKIENRLPKEPEIIYKDKFTNWINYLSIQRVYYDLDTCKKRINELLINNPEIKNTMDISVICSKLCELDNNLPDKNLWYDYYNINNINDILNIRIKRKK